MFPQLFSFAFLLITSASAASLGRRQIPSGQCGMSVLEELACVEGEVIGENTQITDLAGCTFTFQTAYNQKTNTFGYTRFVPSDQQHPEPRTGFYSPQANPTLIHFKLNGGTISTDIAPVPAGGPTTHFILTDARPDLYNSQNVGIRKNIEPGYFAAVAGNLQYKCINDEPALILIPPTGRDFVVDTAPFTGSVDYAALWFEDTPGSGGRSATLPAYQPMDIVVVID